MITKYLLFLTPAHQSFFEINLFSTGIGFFPAPAVSSDLRIYLFTLKTYLLISIFQLGQLQVFMLILKYALTKFRILKLMVYYY